MSAPNWKQKINGYFKIVDTLAADRLIDYYDDRFFVITDNYLYFSTYNRSRVRRYNLRNDSTDIIAVSFDDWLANYQIGHSAFNIIDYISRSLSEFFEPPPVPYNWIYSALNELRLFRIGNRIQTIKITDTRLIVCSDDQIRKEYTPQGMGYFMFDKYYLRPVGFCHGHFRPYYCRILDQTEPAQKILDDIQISESFTFDVKGMSFNDYMTVAATVQQIYSRNIFRSTKKYRGYEDCIIICPQN